MDFNNFLYLNDKIYIVRTKYWNLFTMDIFDLIFILIYNNSTSLVLLVYNLNHNITSLIDLSNNSYSQITIEF